MNNNFKAELVKTDIIPRELNEISKKYKQMFLDDLKQEIIKTKQVVQCQCGSKNLEVLAKIDRFGLPFESLICKDCGLVITNPQIAEESLPYYYDKYYHPLNYGKEHLENQEALFANGQGAKIFNILKPYLPNKRKLRVLEVGAGTGNVLKEFKEEAKKNNIIIDEIGTEYSNDCIKIAKEKYNIDIIYGDIQTVVNKNLKFDIIILSHVFEHFTDLKKELNNLKFIMDKDTLLYIEVPGIKAIHKSEYYGFSLLGYLIHAHMYNFTKNTLENILQINGFKTIFSNENVEAIFKIGIEKNIKINNDYEEVYSYLKRLYNSYDLLKEVADIKINNIRRWLDKEKEEKANIRRWLDKEKEEKKKLKEILKEYEETNILFKIKILKKIIKYIKEM